MRWVGWKGGRLEEGKEGKVGRVEGWKDGRMEGVVEEAQSRMNVLRESNTLFATTGHDLRDCSLCVKVLNV